MTNKKKNHNLSLSQSITQLKPALQRATPPSTPASSVIASTTTPNHFAAADEPTDLPSSTPPKPSSQPLKLKQQETFTNAEGMIFKAGDLIEVNSPWGTNAIAQIESIFLSPTGNTWIHYLPQQDSPQGWNWEGGVIQSELLKKSQ
ncbi:MAG: hypothetical protein F6K09_15455 [Merismopedia sp. SIO2A8]|nr:hypothetical protein [Symploca sp. SIO2B6]NET50082.1 hypothetical protein [Merismopedia sp. SIO2A8]